MTAYAIAQLRNVEMTPGLAGYVEAIDSTLLPFEGRFIIHGGEKHHLEGNAAGDLIVIAFPDLDAARAWYVSPDYQAIAPKRIRNSEGDVFLIEGVSAGHRATDILSR